MNAESGRNNLPQEGAHQLVVQYQTVNPENIQTNDTILMHQDIFRIYMNIHINMHVTTINEKEIVNLKDSKGRVYGKVYRDKGKGEMILFYNLKIKERKFSNILLVFS